VAGGVFPGAVSYRSVAGRPLEVRSVWEYKGREGEEGAYAQCFQGKLVLECHDDIPTAADGWGGGSWRDPVTARNCSEYERLGWCRGHVSSVLEPLAHPPAPTAGGAPNLMPTDDRFRAARVCCACGGGRTKAIYTQVKCVHVAVLADAAPELLVAAQVTLLSPAQPLPRQPRRAGPPGGPEDRAAWKNYLTSKKKYFTFPGIRYRARQAPCNTLLLYLFGKP